MKIIKGYYDKIIFSCSLLLVGFLFTINFVSDEDAESRQSLYSNNGFFEIQENGSEIELSFYREMDLMPGDFIFAELESGETAQSSIDSVFFKRRSSILVFTNEGKTVAGKVSSNQNLLLEGKWKTQMGAVNVETKTGTQSVPIANIEKILGMGPTPSNQLLAPLIGNLLW